MIKLSIKKLLKCLMWIASRVFPYTLSERMRAFRDVLYTMWICNYIGHMGEHSTISKPCSLQGCGQKRISIGDYTCIQSHGVLGCWERYGEQRFSPSLTIGNHCSIGEYNHITACNKITIGDGLLTGRFVYIGDNSHGGLSIEEATVSPAERKLYSKGEIVIGNNVWIGSNATILQGVTIGDGAIIGANTVVTKDVSENTIVAGIPAKVIKYLDTEKIQS
jgi:acetyltransferase-like isoleucine patch superfamily enzyme